MRQRQMEFYRGWDQEEAAKKQPVDMEGGGELQEEYEGEGDGGDAEETVQAKGRKDEDEEEQSEPVSYIPSLVRFFSYSN